MDMMTEKAVISLDRLRAGLQIFGVYMKPHHSNKLKYIHMVFCTILMFHSIAAFRSTVLVWSNPFYRMPLRIQWLLAMVNLVLIEAAVNVYTGRLEAVISNCVDFLKSSSLPHKTKTNITYLSNCICGLCTLQLVFFLLFFLILPFSMGEEFINLSIYPFKVNQTGAMAYVLILIFVPPSAFTTTLIHYLPLVNIYITYLELHSMISLNTEIQTTVHTYKTDGNSHSIEELRKKHLNLVRKIKQHNEVMKFPVAVYIGITIAECCLSIYMVTIDVSFMATATSGLMFMTGFLSTVSIVWCGIKLTSVVSVNIFFINYSHFLL